MPTLRRIVLAALTLGAALVVAPATHAATGAMGSIHGGCAYHAEPTTGNSWSGVIYDVSATFDAAGQPESAIVTCWLEIYGVEVAGTRHSYGDIPGVHGVQAGAHSFAYNAGPEDEIIPCRTVQWADGITDTECFQVSQVAIPPQVTWDLFDELTGDGHAVCGTAVDACAVLCPLLPSVSGTYWRVTIGPDGDVYLLEPGLTAYHRVLDCAPYGNPY